MNELTEDDVREARLESLYHLLMAKKMLMLVGDGAGGSAVTALEESETILQDTLEEPTITGTSMLTDNTLYQEQ